MKKYIATSFVATAFFVSGACGLIYEVLWNRYLADLIGSTSLSELVVLMVFMGGLSLGAFMVGRLVDQRFSSLSCYGFLELGIGLYAIFFPSLFEKFSGLFNALVTGLLPGSTFLFIVKVVSAAMLIVLPALAMGGTLPAGTRYLTASHGDLRQKISLLYGVNCLGAVVGVLVGGFVVVHYFGLAASMIYTGVMNISLGLVALVVSWWTGHRRLEATETVANPRDRREDLLDALVYRPYAVKRAIAAAGISGFAAMALQVAWIRYFGIVLGATHSAFTIVVGAFIFGIGLGALLVGTRPAGRLPLPTLLTGAFALTAATIGLGLFFYAWVPFEIARHLQVIARIPFAWPFYEVLRFGICFMLMLLPTVASGMILPICVRIAGRGVEWVGRDVALVYSVNTLGALLGIAVTEQFLFRVLTLPRTLQTILVFYLGGSVFLALILKERGRKRIFAFIVVLTVIHFSLWSPWLPQQIFVSRPDFLPVNSSKYADFVKENEKKVLVSELQGPDVQAVTLDFFENGDGSRALFINGKPDAANELGGIDMATQLLLAQLPLLLHSGAENVFVLGLGSGVTTGEALSFPGVAKVTTAELAGAVVAASKDFAASNGRYWENPKHRMVIDDGKTFLQLTREKFDVIIMEPTNVWQEGMAGLFSEDFFRLAKSRLNAGGVVGQWMHLYQVDDRSVNIVLKTFSRAFPSASVFMMTPFDILLVGYDEGWRFEAEKMQRLFYQPQILADQQGLSNLNPSALLLREILSRRDFLAYTTALNTNINTTNFPVLEQAAEYGLFLNAQSTMLEKLDSRLDPDGEGLLIQEYARRFAIDRQALPAIIEAVAATKNERLWQSLDFRYLSELWGPGQDFPPGEALAYLYDPELRGIIMHPYYRREADRLTGNDAFNLLGAELLVWEKAASQLWTPDPQRLRQLYDRFAAGVDRENSGRVARNAGLALARGRACGAALPFFRIAEAKGQLAPEQMPAGEIAAVFHCEVKVGELAKGRYWWQVIEEKQLALSEEMRRDKSTLDIKLGGLPPAPVYGRLPSLYHE